MTVIVNCKYFMLGSRDNMNQMRKTNEAISFLVSILNHKCIVLGTCQDLIGLKLRGLNHLLVEYKPNHRVLDGTTKLYCLIVVEIKTQGIKTPLLVEH